MKCTSVILLPALLVILAVSLVAVEATRGYHYHRHRHHHNKCESCPAHKELQCSYKHHPHHRHHQRLHHYPHLHHHRHHMYCYCIPRNSCDGVVCPREKECILHHKYQTARCVRAALCNRTRCHAEEVCTEMAYRSRTKVHCRPATSCDQITCPMGFDCMVSRRKARCVVSCTGVTCPSHQRCRSEGHRAVCRPVSSCSDVMCPANTMCLRYSHHRVGCFGDSCDTISCPDGAQCLEFKGKVKRSWWGMKKSWRKPSKTWAACAHGCSSNTCPNGLICSQYHYHKAGPKGWWWSPKKKELAISCEAPRCCSSITCPTGERCEQQYVNKKPVAVCVPEEEGSGISSAIPPPPPALPPPPADVEEGEAGTDF